jgi:hypothetical protein
MCFILENVDIKFYNKQGEFNELLYPRVKKFIIDILSALKGGDSSPH